VDTTLAPEPVIEVAEVPVEEGVEEESAPLVAETGLDSVDEAAVEDAPAVAEEAALAVADEVVEEAPATELAAAIDTDEPTAAATPVSTASVVPVLPAMQGVAPTEANLLAAVEQWVDAWQAQNLDGYFSAYHTDFAPLYQSTRAAWRDNRVRSIQRPAAITIGLEEFQVVGDAEVGMQVAFWLNYQSPDYADRTYKELVIGNDVDGSLR